MRAWVSRNGRKSVRRVGLCDAGQHNGGMTQGLLLTRTRDELARALDTLHGRRALVMTMGALHAGHLELVKRAKESSDHVVVTIFVNPTQFAPGEDFEAYPRTLAADVEALTHVGADLVWAPAPEDAYPEPIDVVIDPGPIARILEGASRPTHFAGVALICTKVMGLVRPDVAFFGEKDAQQLALLRHVFTQLDVPVKVEGVPIVRDEDEVALSSRNRYLSKEERCRARSLSAGLRAGAKAWEQGASAEETVAEVVRLLEGSGGIDIDYVVLVDEQTFTVLAASAGVALGTEEERARVAGAVEGRRPTRLLLAARIGTTRLIDNTALALRAGTDE